MDIRCGHHNSLGSAMQLLLQSHTNYKKIGAFDTRTLSLEERDKVDGETIVKSGLYAQLGQKQLYLFGKGGIPYLAIDQTLIEFTSDIEVVLKNDSEYQHITIMKNGKKIKDWCYKKPAMDVPSHFMNFCAEEDEDFDFGVFLKILSKDPKRLFRVVQPHRSIVKLYKEKRGLLSWLKTIFKLAGK